MYYKELHRLKLAMNYPSYQLFTLVNVVMVLTGMKCNCSCQYCMNEEKSIDLPNVLDKRVIEYLNDSIDMFPPTTPLRIFFSNGEPLLYLDLIEEVVRKVKRGSAVFHITTNGTQFTDETVKKLNLLRINVSISHDGPYNLITRGYDCSDQIRHYLPKLRMFGGFMAVVTKLSPDIWAIDNFLTEKFCLSGKTGVVRYRHRNDEREYLAIDPELARATINRAMDNFLKSKDFNGIDWNYLSSFVEFRMFAELNPSVRFYPFRETTAHHPMIDLQGNIYSTQFKLIKIGHVTDPLSEVLYTLLNSTNNITRCNKVCPGYDYCLGGGTAEYRTQSHCDYINTVAPALDKFMEVCKRDGIQLDQRLCYR